MAAFSEIRRSRKGQDTRSATWGGRAVIGSGRVVRARCWHLAVGQQTAGQALDIAGFRNGRMYRVVRALAAAFEQLDVAVQMAGAGHQDVLQFFFLTFL